MLIDDAMNSLEMNDAYDMIYMPLIWLFFWRLSSVYQSRCSSWRVAGVIGHRFLALCHSLIVKDREISLGSSMFFMCVIY